MNNQTRIKIYTDGGADPNPGPGGWGAVLLYPDQTQELSGGDADTTNNRMELTAAIEALKSLPESSQIDLYTDSQYLRNGITKWIHNWIKRGWLSDDSSIANVDLWKALHEQVQAHKIEWYWVRGHMGNTYNERAHELASAAIPRTKTEVNSNVTRVYLRIAGTPTGKEGSCGWAACIVRAGEEEFFSGSHRKMSINHFALYAASEILHLIPTSEPIQFFTNHGYLLDGITKWVNGWRKGKWERDIKFKEDWQSLDSENLTRDIKWLRWDNDAEPELQKNLAALAQDARI